MLCLRRTTSQFDPISGNHEVRPEGKNNAVLVIPNAKFQAGNTYTVVLTGKATGTPKLEALIIRGIPLVE
jgi:hypothetical protein